MRDKDEMIAIPASVLQALLWNVEQSMLEIVDPSACDKAIRSQSAELQDILTPEDYVDPNEGFTLDDSNNIYYLNFGKRV
jgi:hypothetical protein